MCPKKDSAEIVQDFRCFRMRFSGSFHYHIGRPPFIQRLQYTLVTASPISSSRLAVLLSRRARLKNPTMALVEVTLRYPPKEEHKPFKEPPAVITTPADPWPRPYYFEDGLRKVAPYHFTYNTYCKQRWRGRELLNVFASEFRDRPLEYYVCVMLGNIVCVLIVLERCHRTGSGHG